MTEAMTVEWCGQRLVEALAAGALVGSRLHVPGVHGAAGDNEFACDQIDRPVRGQAGTATGARERGSKGPTQSRQ